MGVKGGSYNLDYVNQLCESKGYKFLGKEYIKANDKYEFLCLKHNKVNITSFTHISTGGSLRCCANERIKDSKQYTIQEVKEDCLKRGFEFLEDEYKGSQIKQLYRCIKHENTMLGTWANIKKKNSMKCCRVEKMSGANNPKYNKTLTVQDRLLGRKILGENLSFWRTQIFSKDKYTCQICSDSVGHNLNAHHIFNWRDYPELRISIDNGVTLCKKCHVKFHKEFGIKNNTKNQLICFIETSRDSRI